ncbi:MULTISPECIES: phosphoenolpyruvate--protein phosphotransferase [Thiorhodovibrio]|uniref:phosphoenolpyruvate--protein phosphotransferase n=1 Tax=Thiorhodovibrio TaxID=61593 RepID=UPI001913D733|nr:MULTISPECIES: phosphoenolpyruvate--protein phosphotransferase [Thiorhodovibrio]MBK5967235.1 phosphoenolpyruvate--protein phosphotransferase [Thiorhodovibrio winogradskyi]WPL14511.1 Phosphoenolpyruvate-protein phosphotransferase [Thiorhodovibrio litoralis]
MITAFAGVGVAGARKLAVGKAYLLRQEPTFSSEPVERPEAELRRLDAALDAARSHLEGVRHSIPANTPAHIAEFIDTHLLMLTDSALVDATRDLIRERHVNAGLALKLQRDILVQVFDEMDDPYLSTRRDDVDHVVRQILVFLGNLEQQQRDVTNDPVDGHVVVTDDLTPADAILLRQRGVAAFVTEHGGPMSHTAILARSLDIPAVMGVHRATEMLRHGEQLVVNAETGTILATSEPEALEFFRRRLRSAESYRRSLKQLLARPSTSRDGVPVVLLANLELPEDSATAQENGASGVGLYRTEFLYLNHTRAPSEDEHLENYLGILNALNGLPLTIRTLDLGLDKNIQYLSERLPPLTNPALGLRAIRLCLKEPELFLPQLRAILRASAAGPVRLMIPMISTLNEVDTLLRLIQTTKRMLRSQGLAFDPLMPIGGMIEVPAAALMAESLARRLDFLSIGTNDLIQYTLAIDRLDDSVSYLYEPLHPAILRLIHHVIEAAAKTRTRVSMCGEMAGDARYTRLLLGLGLREFSMQPGSLLEVKAIVRDSDIGALVRTMDELMPRIDDISPQSLLDRLAEAT